jgi:rhomboid domain-containing protein 1
MSRAAETLASVPPATRSILALCVLTYACQVLLDPPIPDYALNPSNILRRGQLYRLVSGSLFHANLVHIVMNAMSSAAIGGMLEKRIGTLMMLFTIVWGILLTSSIYVLVSWLAYVVLGYEALMLRNCVGFSGVIFQLSVLESNYGPEDRTRSVFGMMEVSSKAYPWALLLALQFIMPQASFLGHLSGILVGTMQCRGALNALFPSDARLRGWEAAAASAPLAFPAGWPGYVAVVPREMTTAMTTTTTGWRGGGGASASAAAAAADDGVRSASSSLAACYRGRVAPCIGGAIGRARSAVFGRGADANSNIRMEMGELLGAAWGSGDANAVVADSAWVAGGDVEDDDEWVGLPAAIHRSTEER